MFGPDVCGMSARHTHAILSYDKENKDGKLENFLHKSDIKVEAAQIMRIKDNLVRMYAQMTGQTQEQIIYDLDRDNFMSAQQAADYGLIDQVIEINENK